MTASLAEALHSACASVGILFRDTPADGRWHDTDIDNATTTSILCACFNLSSFQPRELSVMIACEIASRMPASGYSTNCRALSKSNKLLVQAVRLGSVCGYSSMGNRSRASRCDTAAI